MATRTAPDITGASSFEFVSIRYVDADDGETTVTFRAIDTLTLAALQALVNLAQTISNASIFEVITGSSWQGAKSKANATDDSYVSVKDVLRLSFKDIASGAYERVYSPSPLGDLVMDNSVVDVSNADYIAWRDAVDAAMPTAFTVLNVAFVQNVQRNKGQSPSA